MYAIDADILRDADCRHFAADDAAAMPRVITLIISSLRFMLRVTYSRC